MKLDRKRSGVAVRAALAAGAIAFGAAASNAYADNGDSGDSVIDLIIDWIDDLFDPEPPVEEPPADDNTW